MLLTGSSFVAMQLGSLEVLELEHESNGRKVELLKISPGSEAERIAGQCVNVGFGGVE